MTILTIFLQLMFRFNLYYYSNPIIKEKDKEKAKRRSETILTIDTRSTRTVNKMLMMDSEDFDLPEENPLEKTIQTKYDLIGQSVNKSKHCR